MRTCVERSFLVVLSFTNDMVKSSNLQIPSEDDERGEGMVLNKYFDELVKLVGGGGEPNLKIRIFLDIASHHKLYKSGPNWGKFGKLQLL